MKIIPKTIKVITWAGILAPILVIHATEKLIAQAPLDFTENGFTENFDKFDPSRFQTEIPNRNSRIRKGVLWTSGDSGGKYPPMIRLDLAPLGLAAQDLEISFRFRFLEQNCLIWFFIDGDDGFGSVDHLLRVKLLAGGVQLQIDSHSLDANDPRRQNKDRAADKVSGAFRLSQKLPKDPIELKIHQWHDIKVVFRGRDVTISVDDQKWNKTLHNPSFHANKHKLLWMQKSGKKGIEIDDLKITKANDPR
ncbi:MAG: LamG domain-containing protein [Rubripirellula sp.]